jgi:hypothetical protein
MSIAFFVMMMTNFIMNVAAIAISLPVALVIAPYLGVAAEVILFSSLVVAGMPFLLLVGAAPNAIAYDSKQFTTGEFFLWGHSRQHSADDRHRFRRVRPVAHHGDAHSTAEDQCIDHEASLDIAIHQLVLGNHLSLLVTKEGDVIGILRLADVFAAVYHTMKECSL